jgi:heptosyltransferase-2
METAPNAGPWFGLNPGAEYGPAKRWPFERFASAAVALQKQTQCRWAIFGGAAERPLAAQIASQIAAAPGLAPALNLAGQTTLRELMAALKSCRLLLTNDSGPMHLAAALGTPLVVLFGSTSPELTAPPVSDRAQVVRASGIPCSPCFLRQCPIDFRCMKTIEPAAAVAAALRALQNSD